MKKIVRGLYNPIQKEYWRQIPKERVDEAVIACKNKYSSGVYALCVFFILFVMGMFFGILRLCTFQSNKLEDNILTIVCALFFIVVGLYLPCCVFLEERITAHKIKIGKAWIKSGKILKIEKKLEEKQEKVIGFFTFCVRKDTIK